MTVSTSHSNADRRPLELAVLLKLIGAASIALLVTFVVLIAMGLDGIRKANVRQTEIYDHEILPAQMSSDIYRLQTIQTIQMMELGTSIDDDGKQARIKLIAELQAAVERIATSFEATVPPDSVLGAKARFVEHRNSYHAAFDQAMSYARKGDFVGMGSIMNLRGRPAGLALARDTDEMNSLMRNATTQSHIEASEAARRQIFLVCGLSLTAVLASVALALWSRRELMRCLGGDFMVLVRSVDQIAQLDLRSIDSRSALAGSVMHGLQRMQHQLVEVVSRIRLNAEYLASASAEIAIGNQDLSVRTEQQSSALRRTVSTMGELGETVLRNTESARRADQLAQSSSVAVKRGEEVVEKVVTTMQGIRESSEKIRKIIVVIDEIALQTNILALNAAAEAARAGDHGRGFAAVAVEVRNLAQRCAAAAKEIKGLIVNSVERVQQGTTLVDIAGHTMVELGASIKLLSTSVAEISAASVTQSSGVRQISDDIGQMDLTTQQNAALVEEGASAAEALKMRAHQLLDSVAGFKLSEYRN